MLFFSSGEKLLSVKQVEVKIKVAVVESDPLRLIGYRSLLEQHPEIEIEAATVPDLPSCSDDAVALVGAQTGRNICEAIQAVFVVRPDLRILGTGPGIDDEMMLKAISSGAKGYVTDSADAKEIVEAIKVVHSGSIWAPRRVLAMFVERATNGRLEADPKLTFTERERQVLELLVAGRSNKEIGAALQIEERTVKAHLAKLMRKVGVPNRIALSVHAVTRSLLE
jgi:DNA-binding NarL/FixJ family response regulator